MLLKNIMTFLRTNTCGLMFSIYSHSKTLNGFCFWPSTLYYVPPHHILISYTHVLVAHPSSPYVRFLVAPLLTPHTQTLACFTTSPYTLDYGRQTHKHHATKLHWSLLNTICANFSSNFSFSFITNFSANLST